MRLCFLMFTGLMVIGGCEQSPPPAPVLDFTPEERTQIARLTPLPSPPSDTTNRYADDPAAAHLGRFLFFDPRLSATGETSCATCHDPQKSFQDGVALPDIGAGAGDRNTVSLWNTAYNRWHFWDGRADSLWGQALQPLERDVELNSDRTHIAHLIDDDPELRQAYEKVFGALPDFSDPDRFPAHARPVPNQTDHPHHAAWSAMSEDDRAIIDRVFVNIAKAIAAYERQLISRDAPFDLFAARLLTDDTSAGAEMSLAAQRGLRLFLDPGVQMTTEVGIDSSTGGCTACHSGPNFTDGEFHNIGIPPAAGGIPRDAGRYTGAALVRADPFNAAGLFSDDPEGAHSRLAATLANPTDNWGRFKTPSLRNVEKTAPYMHQGQFATLGEVLHFYNTLEGAVQLDHHREQILIPLELSSEDLADLEAFLRTLTSEKLDPALLTAPESPIPGQ